MGFLADVADQEPWLKQNSLKYHLELAEKSVIMSEEHKRLIQEHYVDLVQHLDIDCVLPFMIADDLLNDEQQELVKNQPCRQDKVRELLTTVLKKGEHGFYSLCRAHLQQQQGKIEYCLICWGVSV